MRPVLFFGVFGAFLGITPWARGHDWNGLAIDSSNRLYAIDADWSEVWQVSPEGKVSLLLKSEAGSTCNHPHHLVLARNGDLILPSG